MRRTFAALALAAIGAVSFIFAPQAPLGAPPARRGDCVMLQVWSNGFHVDIAAPADMLPATHPLRLLYPHARSFLIGWGDEAFYRSNGENLWLGLAALVPPSPSAMHVVAGDRAVENYFRPRSKIPIGVSREGAEGLARYLTHDLVLRPDGLPVVVAPGHLPGRSVFLRTRGDFHLFNVCNHWMARALRAAGVDVNARAAWLADALAAQARRAAPAACPM